MGLPSGVASMFLELYDAINRNIIPYEPRTAANTTPTDLEAFLPILLKAQTRVGA